VRDKMPDFNEFLNTLKINIKEFAENNWRDHLEDVISDGSEFLRKTEDDMKRWTRLLAEGSLTPADLKFLVLGKKDLAEMEALKRAGLALVQVDKCRNGIIDLVVGTALDVFT
jgi:hypothetical protein